MNLFALLGLGMWLGLRHAADPDHVVAGSAAVALLVLATVREPRWAAGYLLVFGLGTLFGMVLITTGFALPVATVARRWGGSARVIRLSTGTLSLVFGLWLVYHIG